jgi:DNA polymerase
MNLPSGRQLYYREPEIGTSKFGYDCVWFMGVNQYTRKWEMIQTYGGKLFENCVQATARDVMKSAMLRIDRLDGVQILGPIHDEVLCELDDPGLEADVAKEMRRPIPWAPGLPIDADGYVGERFGK